MFEAAELALYRLGAQPAHNNRTQLTAQVLISTSKQQSAAPASKAPSRTVQNVMRRLGARLLPVAG